MGITGSIQNIKSFQLYNTRIQQNTKSIYFGQSFSIYKNKYNFKQLFTKHTIKFNNTKQMNLFLQQIKLLINNKANHIPFNILYPINVFLKQQSSIIDNLTHSCHQSNNQLILIHKWLGKTLEQVVKQHNKGLNQKFIWFIINQLTKSLQLLQQKNHASHHIMPENIFLNHNQNIFIYDGHFVLSNQYIQDFYKLKLSQKQFLSQQFIKKINSNIIINNYQAIQQDIYCLGYVIIYMMTTLHPKQMPIKQSQRNSYVHDLLQAITQDDSQNQSNNQSSKSSKKSNNFDIQKYSTELNNFVRGLIKSDSKRRYSIRHIRSYLKNKQQQIFINQEQQWSRTTMGKSDNPFNEDKNKNSYFKKNQLKTSQRLNHNKLLTQSSDANIQKNGSSLRTLKKQPVPQKLVMINNKNVPSFPISLQQNSYNSNHHLRQGLTTPIRKIQEVKSRQFIDHNRTNNIIIQEDKRNVHQSNYDRMRGMNSPGRLGIQEGIVSPNKISVNEIYSNNPRVYNRQVSNYRPAMNNISYAGNAYIGSPPHSGYQSPIKIKLNYFSPQKNYY